LTLRFPAKFMDLPVSPSNASDEVSVLFKYLDIDGNGFIESCELHSKLNEIGYLEDEIERIFMLIDTNGDGVISFEEFEEGFDKFKAIFSSPLSPAVRSPANKLEPLRRLAESYELGEVIGEGAFSVVRLGTDRATGEQHALKIMDRKKMSESELKMLNQEVEILQSVKHPNIVTLHETLEEGDTFCVALEVLSGGELFDRIIDAPEGHYTEADACETVIQMVGAVAHLHRLGIVHRDLKPENLLLATPAADALIKISDFGFATRLDVAEKTTFVCGSPGYVAPEVLTEEGYGFPCDMWSVGAIVFTMLTGMAPFLGETDEASFEKTRLGTYDLDALPDTGVSEAAQDFVAQLLQINPKDRITADKALEHAWLTGGASSLPLTATQANLKRFIARKRLKRAMHLTLATTKMSIFSKLTKVAKLNAKLQEVEPELSPKLAPAIDRKSDAAVVDPAVA